jgi:hypothetical protein
MSPADTLFCAVTQVLSLNSIIDAGAGSHQAQRLRSELAAGARRCTVAYWHHAVFSSGPKGDSPQMRFASCTTREPTS